MLQVASRRGSQGVSSPQIIDLRTMLHVVYGALIFLSFVAGALVTWLRMENSYLFEEIPVDDNPLSEDESTSPSQDDFYPPIDQQPHLLSILSNQDLLVHIGLYLNAPSIACLSICSSIFNRYLKSEIFWQQLWKLKYGSIFTSNDLNLQKILAQRGIDANNSFSP